MEKPDSEQSTSSSTSTYRVPDDEKRCTATSARTGERCRARRARGYETCAGHAGLGFNRDPEAAREAGKRGGHARARVLASARQEAMVRAVSTPRELMLAEMARPLGDGRVAAAVDRGLASSDERVALQAAGLVLDRLFGKPVAIAETQPAGTQAYVELRATLATLPEADRLSYLREARMTADVALHPPPPHPHAHTHELTRGEGDEGGGGGVVEAA